MTRVLGFHLVGEVGEIVSDAIVWGRAEKDEVGTLFERVSTGPFNQMNAFLLEGGPCDLWLSFSPLSCTSELLFPTFPLLFHPHTR